MGTDQKPNCEHCQEEPRYCEICGQLICDMCAVFSKQVDGAHCSDDCIEDAIREQRKDEIELRYKFRMGIE